MGGRKCEEHLRPVGNSAYGWREGTVSYASKYHRKADAQDQQSRAEGTNEKVTNRNPTEANVAHAFIKG